MEFLQKLVEERYVVAAMALFVIGFMNLLHQRDLIRKVVGFNIMDAAVFLFIASRGYVAGRLTPIVHEAAEGLASELYINPIPTGLVLTGIVVSVSASAFSLAVIQRIHKKYGTTDIRQIVLFVKKED